VSDGQIVHAGLIALRSGGVWRGVLVQGPADAGKSDLALRALSQGFSLVADDRVLLWTSGGRLYGRAPDALCGLIEVRGVDVVRIAALPLAEIALVAEAGIPERIPERAFADILGLRVPKVILRLGEPSAPAKLSRALSHFDGEAKRRI
jgi:serine kinase of HPr protein (carbohydrate metabolism regulator)